MRLSSRFASGSCLLLLAVGLGRVPLVEGAPDRDESSLLRIAQASFAGVIDRIDRCSFRYRLLPEIGELSVGDALSQLHSVFKGAELQEAVQQLTSQWTDAQWNAAVVAARAAWQEVRPRELSEFVRAVQRYGNTYLDIDEGLLAYRIERPTSGRLFQSPAINITWFTLRKEVLIPAGTIDPGDRPNARYFLMPTAIAMPAMHAQGSVKVQDQTPDNATISIQRNTEEHRYIVHRALRWLPSESSLHVGGVLIRTSVFQWMSVDGVGAFPAAIATVDRVGDAYSFRLACFRDPTTAAQSALDQFSVPSGTRVVDERRSPRYVKPLRAASDLEDDWAKYIRLGEDLPIPASVSDLLKPPPGQAVPTVSGR